MGILKRKKKSITIEKTGSHSATIKANCVMSTGEVADLLLDSLCTVLRAAAKEDKELEVYKAVAIKKIEEICWFKTEKGGRYHGSKHE